MTTRRGTQVSGRPLIAYPYHTARRQRRSQRGTKRESKARKMGGSQATMLDVLFYSLIFFYQFLFFLLLDDDDDDHRCRLLMSSSCPPPLPSNARRGGLFYSLNPPSTTTNPHPLACDRMPDCQ